MQNPSFGNFLSSNSAGVASLAAGGITNFFSSMSQARSYESQARLALLADRQQALYEQEQLRAEGQNIFSQYKAFAGTQKVAMAATGFTDYSTGDVRLFADTARKQAAAIDSLNQSYTAQRQETERQALMNAISLRAAAKGAKISAWTGAANTLLQGAGMYQSYSTNFKQQQKIQSQLGQFAEIANAFKTQNKGLNIAPVA